MTNQRDEQDAPATPVTTAAAWPTWLSIGACGFGGPAGQVALIHREVVERRKWLDEDEFLAAMRLCMLLPGPEAQQLATYVGWRCQGIVGGIVAGTLFVLPGALIVTALAWLRIAGGSLPAVTAMFAGARPAVVALVFLAAWRIGRRSIRSPALAVFGLAAAGLLAAGCSFPVVVVLAAVLGSLLPERVLLGSGAAAAGTASGPPAIPQPPRGRSWMHPLTIALVAMAFWAVAYAAVWFWRLAGGRAAEIAVLFTETTLLSLGGAYAVVPWALDEATARHWLEASERFDALAMGEATPGPLILVVTFIGFLAGWRGDLACPHVGGLEGAATATLFAFLPSFAMVLSLAPWVRSIRAGSRLARAMAAVGAVVVAAIGGLGVRLAAAAALPDGQFDPWALAVGSLAGIALSRGWLSAPLTIATAAAIGGLTRIAAS